MKAYYDSKPSKLEAVGNGSYLYRYNIEETDAPVMDGEEPRTEWSCDEVTVWPPVTSNRIVEKAIAEEWPNNYEQKLVNEYNAAQLGLYDEGTAAAKTAAYNSFLTSRQALKDSIDTDCAELGIK